MLDKYPDIKARLKEMLAIAEGPSHGEFSSVDAIEERTIGVVRHIGKDLIQNWAVQQSAQMGVQIQKRMQSAQKNTKKIYWHSTLGKIESQELTYYQPKDGSLLHPFLLFSHIRPRGYSRILQRA